MHAERSLVYLFVTILLLSQQYIIFLYFKCVSARFSGNDEIVEKSKLFDIMNK